MEFIDLGAQRRHLKTLDQRMSAVLAHSKFIMGPEIEELERRLSNYVGVKHCVSVANGTDALQIAMMAAGIQPGDEIITTSFSFFATVETILLLGAKPVFADIDPHTYNLNPNQIEKLITPKTKMILPVSLYGQCADFEAISKIAKKHSLLVLEDAAQSFGASVGGKKSCSLTPLACTSFFPTKPLGCYGDGGACFTSDDELASRMKKIRVHGQEKRYFHTLIGVNSRLDTLQAAVLLSKMEVFDEELHLRKMIAKRYDEALKGIVLTPQIAPGFESAYAQYTIEVDDRERIQKVLQDKGIPTMVHYPFVMHKQPAYQLRYSEQYSLPHSERAASRVLSLPFHPYLSESDQDQVVEALIKALRANAA